MELIRRCTLVACAVSLALVSGSLPAEPYFTDSSGRPLPMTRTVCGTDKMSNMADESASLQALGHPIGIYRVSSPDGLEEACTGTLVDTDLFLTARHCAADCAAVSVTFGFLARSEQETFACKEVVERGGDNENEDYLVIRLEGKPGVKWGWHALSDKPLEPGESLLMIHHPEALPMKVSRKECVFKEEVDGMIRHRCDTNPGSSGAAILKADLRHPASARIVGVHTQGGCDSTADSFNSGPSVRKLTTLSEVIRNHLKP